MEPIRLQKYLSRAGVCSRRKGEAMIAEGRVAVNGQIITEPGVKVDPEKDAVSVDGRTVEQKEKTVYIMLNKPRGVVSSCSHPGRRIVLDLVDVPERVYPVGRLDKDSTGLLLLSNDGDLHLRLSHPSYDHEKEYRVTAAAPVSDEALSQLAAGVALSDGKTRPAKVKRISANRFTIVLKEGRNRQVRRMVESVGNKVTALQRVRMGNLKLGDLAEGAYRFLTAKEKDALLALVAEKPDSGQRHPKRRKRIG